MKAPQKSIVSFLKKQHVLSLATCCDNKPYAASCFYVFVEEDCSLIFASDEATKHIQDALAQPNVAGTIALQTIFIARIKGIQFTGKLFEINDDGLRKKYIKRFPVAAFMHFKLWKIELNFIKMTDNRKGLGNKLIWKRDQE